MRVFIAILGLGVLLLQYQATVSDRGLPEVARLTAAVEAQTAANVEQRARNRQLVAEVNDLKGGLTALEERARSELGMVGNNEVFYQVVTRGTPLPGAPLPAASPAAIAPVVLTARAR